MVILLTTLLPSYWHRVNLEKSIPSWISSPSGDSGNGEVMIPALKHIEGTLNKIIEDRGLPLL